MPGYNPLVGDATMMARSPVYQAVNNGDGRAANVVSSAQRTIQGNLSTSRSVALILLVAMGTVFALHYTGFRGTVTIGAR